MHRYNAMTKQSEPLLAAVFFAAGVLGALALLLSLGCASRLDRVVARAGGGLAYDATYLPTPGGNPNTLKFLEQRAEWLGVTVGYRPEGHEDLRGATGLSYRNGHERHVIVAETLSINGRIEVLAHELGHMYQPNFGNRMDADAFAELVAVEICRRLGVNSSAASIKYLRGQKMSLSVGKVYRAEIRFVADLLTKGFE